MEEEIKEEKGQEEDEQTAQPPEATIGAGPDSEGEEPLTQEESKDDLEKPLEKMTATELREVAKQIPGVTGATAMKKEQLIAVIKEARGIKDEEPVKGKEGAVSGQDASVRELKQKVARLKEEKVIAHRSKERVKVDILRRRINRLKKRTRKVAQA